ISIIFTFSCKEKEINDEDLPRVYSTAVDVNYSINNSSRRADSALIYVYGSELDYISDTNIIQQGYVNNGRYYIQKDEPYLKDFWFRVVQEKLSNERRGENSTKIGSGKVSEQKTCGSCGSNEILRKANVY